jgi:hypothetical protein
MDIASSRQSLHRSLPFLIGDEWRVMNGHARRVAIYLLVPFSLFSALQ